MTRQVECRGCGTPIEYEPIQLRGHVIEIAPICDSCGEKWQTEEEARRSEELYRRRLDRSNLPPSRTSATIPTGPLGRIALDWSEGRLLGLVLTGPVGVGKTHLAAAACMERLRRGPVRWVSAARLMTQLRSGLSERARAEASEIVAGSEPIVLDDLDKAADTEYGREVVFTAIDNRIEAESSLLITANLGLEGIAERYGEAVASRLAGYCRVVRLEGDDKRLKEGTNG